ncbi:prepilin-type N-terminal cleavage/methylation domain-containing protein [Clostridium saccharoperbutylacetonicum]|uniref:prepilin-type N-terminal cleavage/methylation domain-containing protein n=1 Tax=Clostridium saccharoperbutylacetonicum TaxID=36745 RepID=UPI000983974C|nr:prepilin-type N-terminal cleavage/methylation domain-containing protein [Clostridium saccharoperbutylacetonicum]AQR96896.1 fimbrial protein precursor [Clostridium saccharoperbutylacetonicum]NSB32774.1 type IV pilus assembly protein PilA [Clostridium saccharoperbutylacetonicum]
MNQLSIRRTNLLTKKKKKGFTLVELIIVIAIIGILAMIAIPKFGQVRTDANKKADIANAKNIQTAVAVKVANQATGYSIPTTSTNTVISNTMLQGIVDSGTTLTSKVNSTAFTAEIDQNGNIHVFAGTNTEVYPTTNQTWQ